MLKKQDLPFVFDAREWSQNGDQDFASLLDSVGCGLTAKLGKTLQLHASKHIRFTEESRGARCFPSFASNPSDGAFCYYVLERSKLASS